MNIGICGLYEQKRVPQPFDLHWDSMSLNFFFQKICLFIM